MLLILMVNGVSDKVVVIVLASVIHVQDWQSATITMAFCMTTASFSMVLITAAAYAATATIAMAMATTAATDMPSSLPHQHLRGAFLIIGMRYGAHRQLARC